MKDLSQKNKEKEKGYDFFDAFGRPGCGAPVKGSNGQTIANIKNIVRSQVDIKNINSNQAELAHHYRIMMGRTISKRTETETYPVK